jgi:hypothetical protein
VALLKMKEGSFWEGSFGVMVGADWSSEMVANRFAVITYVFISFFYLLDSLRFFFHYGLRINSLILDGHFADNATIFPQISGEL